MLATALESPGPLNLANPRVSPRALKLALEALDAAHWHQTAAAAGPLPPRQHCPPTYDDYCFLVMGDCRDFAVEHLHALHWLGLLDVHLANSRDTPTSDDYVVALCFAEDLAADDSDMESAGMPFATAVFSKADVFADTWEKLRFLNTMAGVTGRGSVGEHLARQAVWARCAHDSRIGLREAELFVADRRWGYERKAELLLLGGFPAFATAALVFSHICGEQPRGDRAAAWSAIRQCYHAGAECLQVEEGLHATLSHLVGMQGMLNSPLWSPAPPEAPHIEHPDTSLSQPAIRQVFHASGCTRGHRPDYTPTFSITSTWFLDQGPGAPPEERGCSMHGFQLRASPRQLTVGVAPSSLLEHPVAASVMLEFLIQDNGDLLPSALPCLAFVRPLSDDSRPFTMPFGAAAPVYDAACMTYVFEDRSATPHTHTTS